MTIEPNKLKIMVCQGTGDEKDSAEIRFGDDIISEVYEENGKLLLALHPPVEKFWKLDYEEFFNLLKKCKKIAQRPVD
jgi:hypothetical protein